MARGIAGPWTSPKIGYAEQRCGLFVWVRTKSTKGTKGPGRAGVVRLRVRRAARIKGRSLEGHRKGSGGWVGLRSAFELECRVVEGPMPSPDFLKRKLRRPAGRPSGFDALLKSPFCAGDAAGARILTRAECRSSPTGPALCPAVRRRRSTSRIEGVAATAARAREREDRPGRNYGPEPELAPPS